MMDEREAFRFWSKVQPVESGCWEWFVSDVGTVLSGYGESVHGIWHSYPAQPFENACWCVQFARQIGVDGAKTDLANVCKSYRQDSIAWAVTETTFITPSPESK